METLVPAHLDPAPTAPRRAGAASLAMVALCVCGYFALVAWLGRFPERFFFDEVWYAGECQRTTMSEMMEWRDHPPVGFALTCAGMRTFGDGPFGFRFASMAMGAGTVATLLFMLARRGVGPLAVGLAGALLVTDPLLVVLGRMSMLDTPLAFFFALAVFSFSESLAARATEGRWLVATGAAIGLAMAVKWSGALLVPSFVLHYLVMHRDRSRLEVRPRYAASLVALPLAVFVGAHVALGFTPADFLHFMQRKIFHHVAYSPMGVSQLASRSYEWLVLWRPIAFMIPAAPGEGYIVATGHPVSHVAALLLMVSVLRGRVTSEAAKLATTLALVQWVAWAWAPRITFLYYLVTITPLLAVEAAAELGSRLSVRAGKAAAIALITLQFGYFAYLFPLLEGRALTPAEVRAYRSNPLLTPALPADGADAKPTGETRSP